MNPLEKLKEAYPRIRNYGFHENGAGWVSFCDKTPDLFLTRDMMVWYTHEQLLDMVKAYDDKFK